VQDERRKCAMSTGGSLKRGGGGGGGGKKGRTSKRLGSSTSFAGKAYETGHGGSKATSKWQ